MHIHAQWAVIFGITITHTDTEFYTYTGTTGQEETFNVHMCCSCCRLNHNSVLISTESPFLDFSAVRLLVPASFCVELEIPNGAVT